MIRFKKVKMQNFFSVGNNPIEIDLDESRTTLVTGKNGAAKSSCCIDSISFALFGKPHRDINKPSVVNSINGKGCLVELQFEIETRQYRIVRGIKPNIFEIYENGQMVNQEAHNRDYQKILEDNILKLNHKSFHQVVVLGSGNYTPFMQLRAYQRRIVVEDLLDISVFADMNKILKERVSSSRDELARINADLDVTNTEIQLLTNHITELRNISMKESIKNEKKKDDLESEIEKLRERNSEQLGTVNKHLPVLTQKLKDKMAEHSKMTHDIVGFNTEIKSKKKHLKFFTDHDCCPTCSQSIDPELSVEKIDEYNESLDKLGKKKMALQKVADELKSKGDELEDAVKELQNLEANVNTNNRIIKNLESQISELERGSSHVDKSKIKKLEAELDEHKREKEALLDQKADANTEREYINAAYELLKDGGIKTKIIRQYLPIMNKFINQYLNVLDFFVKFELDETFDETIKSRHIDTFKYASFSEGEKARLDLALLFAWRQIARLKNSANTNLLILDEVFAGNLDTDGSDNLMEIIHSLPDDTKVFIITHDANLMENKFDRRLTFSKNNNFSELKIEKNEKN